jgi:hypothetical protein
MGDFRAEMSFRANLPKSTFVDWGVREGGLGNDSPRIHSPGEPGFTP